MVARWSDRRVYSRLRYRSAMGWMILGSRSAFENIVTVVGSVEARCELNALGSGPSIRDRKGGRQHAASEPAPIGRH